MTTESKKGREKKTVRKKSQRIEQDENIKNTLAYLGHRRVALQSRGQHDASLRQQLLPLVVKGIDAVLTQLFEGDGGRLVLASDNDGVESGVGLQGLHERLSSSLAQLVPGSIEPLYRGVASQNMSKHYASACLQLLPLAAFKVQLGDSVLADLLDGNAVEDFEMGLVNDGEEELSGVRIETIRINMELRYPK